jgi:hypothetical protein
VSRFIVTELEGWATPRKGTGRTSSKPGLSVMVLDTAICHRVMATYRSEDHVHRGSTAHLSRNVVRNLAREKANELGKACAQ